MARGIRRFEGTDFGAAEAAQIHAMIAAGDRDEADDELRHFVHVGVAPTALWEAAEALGRRQEG